MEENFLIVNNDYNNKCIKCIFCDKTSGTSLRIYHANNCSYKDQTNFDIIENKIYFVKLPRIGDIDNNFEFLDNDFIVCKHCKIIGNNMNKIENKSFGYSHICKYYESNYQYNYKINSSNEIIICDKYESEFINDEKYPIKMISLGVSLIDPDMLNLKNVK